MVAAVEDGSDTVSCHVLLGASYQGHIVIKALHEDMGPGGHSDPPARVLAALSPTSNEYARVFRAEMRKAIENKARARKAVGKVIEFSAPVGYGGEHADRTAFRVQSLTRFTLPDGPKRFVAPKGWWMREFDTVPALAEMG